MKVAAKQNSHFSCQVRYQRHAAKYHRSLSSFYIFHKSLLPWSMHKSWLRLRNALKCAPLKSVSWLHSGKEELSSSVVSCGAGTVGCWGKTNKMAKCVCQPGDLISHSEEWMEIMCQGFTDLTAVTALLSCPGQRCLQWFQSMRCVVGQESLSQLVSKCLCIRAHSYFLSYFRAFASQHISQHKLLTHLSMG